MWKRSGSSERHTALSTVRIMLLRQTFAPGDPGKPGAPAGPTGPCEQKNRGTVRCHVR